MCLTEPHCGTDLGIIKTRAVPNADGSHAISGTKIFISAGEHDLSENIVHLVLAKLPDAPAGTKGISLFIVPKFLPDAEGNVGARNAVSCGSIEHKMGIKASATCAQPSSTKSSWRRRRSWPLVFIYLTTVSRFFLRNSTASSKPWGIALSSIVISPLELE